VGRVQIGVRTGLVAIASMTALVLAGVFALMLLEGRGLPDSALDNDPARVQVLEAFLRASPAFNRMQWVVNGPSRTGAGVRFAVLSPDAPSSIFPNALLSGVNAAYHRRFDAILISPGLADLVVRAERGSWLSNFIALLLLHELGHRDSYRNGNAAADTKEEEQRADAYAIAAYVAASQISLSELVEEVWNIAEGGVLGVFTQYGQFDPMTDYPSHGSFFSRIANFYAALLKTPGLSPDDASFVKALADQAQALVHHARSFTGVFSIDLGRNPLFGVNCGPVVRVIDESRGIYSIPRSVLGARGNADLTFRRRQATGPDGTDSLEIRRAACDVAGALIIENFDGKLLKEHVDVADTIRFVELDPATTKTLECNECATVFDGFAGPHLKRETAGDRARFSVSGKAEFAIEVPSSAVAAIDSLGALAVAKPDGDEILVSVYGTDGHAIFRTSFMPIGLRAALGTYNKIENLQLRFASEGSACFALGLPGRFLALVDPTGKQLFVDSYLSFSDVIVPIGGARFLVAIAYSRFLVVLPCQAAIPEAATKAR
jgi:hypothetical protein